MFNKKTVFILGAGASVEFTMPSGEKLKREIGELLSHASEVRGDETFTRFRSLLMNMGQNWQDLLAAGKHLSAAMPSFISIDEALHYFSGEENAVLVGKFAIAYLLLKYETNSAINFDADTRRVQPQKCANTWLAEFLSLALSFARRNEIDGIFSNVTFINFNYDRTLEQYLRYALEIIGCLHPERAEAVANSLNVIRPYGSLGDLPWQKGQSSVEFGLDLMQFQQLGSIGRGILTYTEQVHDAARVQKITNALHTAELIIVIGFGFHRQNLALLKASGNDRPVFATAFEIGRDNYNVIENDIGEGLMSSRVGLFDEKGYEFMKKLRPTISAAAS
jgi:hypothetical protein